MCYQLTKPENGGWHYTLTVSNTTLHGWRKGTRSDVEHYIKRSELNCQIRARGSVPYVGKDGTIQAGLTAKKQRGKKKKPL